MTQRGQYPGKSSGFFFLPMIDMNPSDLSYVYSTLLFVCREARRYQRTPVLTFDQPLFWKAMTIIWNEPDNSQLKSIVIRLGAFHTEMSFLSCIGHIVEGFGIQEILEIIYATNTVPHMLSGKAIAGAIRCYFLIDTALHCLLGSALFGINLPSSDENDLGEQTPLDSENNTILEEASKMYNQCLDKTLCAEAVLDHQVLKQLHISFKGFLEQRKESRTARLWIQYLEMIQILRSFIRAERSGDWDLHLRALQDMLPYFAAAGRNLYTKSGYVYLMMMQNLDIDHPDVYQAFKSSFHVVRRSERYWAGLSTSCN